MPKLIGYRERTVFNYYDAVVYGRSGMERMASGPQTDLRLFGMANIGDIYMSDLTAPFGNHELTSVITNWYVRTNLQPSPQLDAWLTPPSL